MKPKETPKDFFKIEFSKDGKIKTTFFGTLNSWMLLGALRYIEKELLTKQYLSNNKSRAK